MIARRAFAMPLVVMLVAVMSIMVAVMLERQTAQQLAVRQQLRSYQEHHGSAGIQEAIDGWLRTTRRSALSDILAPDGKAFDLELSDGSVLSVYMSDAQGQVLSPTAGVFVGEDAPAVIRVYEYLKERVPEGVLSRMTRQVGPAAVSAMSAPPEVLEAMFVFASGGKDPSKFVSEIVSQRESGVLDARALAAALVGNALDQDQTTRLTRLVVLEPSLWRVVAELRAGRGPRRGQLISRYTGLIPASGSGAAVAATPGTGVSWQQRTAFFTWEPVPVDGPRPR